MQSPRVLAFSRRVPSSDEADGLARLIAKLRALAICAPWSLLAVETLIDRLLDLVR